MIAIVLLLLLIAFLHPILRWIVAGIVILMWPSVFVMFAIGFLILRFGIYLIAWLCAVPIVLIKYAIRR